MRLTGHGRVISVLLVLVAFAIVLGLVVAALTVWPGRRSSPEAPGTRVVVASIFPLASLCADVGGDEVQVSTLVPAGASPHTYEMTPSQARTLAGAHLVFQVGGDLDPFVTRLVGAAAESAHRLEAIAALPAEALLAEAEEPGLAQGAVTGGTAPPEMADPHIWLDPVLVRDHVVPMLQDEMSALWPEHAGLFAANAAALRDRLTELDGWIREQIAPVREKGLISIHPAWGYFGRRYDLETWAVEQHAGTEPSPLWLAELVDIARFRGIQTLFSEPQLSGQIAGIIERELQVQVLVLDPLGGANRPGYGSYGEMMRSNVETIVKGLR